MGEEPAPRQTGEPRAGAEGEETDTFVSVVSALLVIDLYLVIVIFPLVLIQVFFALYQYSLFYLCYTAFI